MDLIREKTYSFDRYSAMSQPAVGWTLHDIVGYTTAMLLGYDVAVVHARTISSLPNGTPADPSKLTYYIFRNQDGQSVCVAKEWIVEDTVQEFSTAEVHVVVRGDQISVQDRERVRLILAENGYSDFTVTLVSK